MKKILCAALFLAACSDPLGSGGLRVRPEQETYAIFGNDHLVTVRYTVTNTGDDAVQVPGCVGNPSAEIQRRQDGAWVTVPPEPTCMALMQIAAGETVTDEVTVQGVGTWRVRLSYRREQGVTGTVDSREFRTRIPLD